MDQILLARLQFAFTIGFHYIFPPLTIGLAWLIFIFESLHINEGSKLYRSISRFWLKLFIVSFAVGVATGITMEFQFGTNWAQYSKFVGDIFGAPLAAEGIFAFFLESCFISILIYGEKRVSPKMYWFSTLMVAIGSTLSAFWIIVANSWQQTPAGFEMIQGKPVLTNFLLAVFNPSTIPRYFHTMSGALITGAFFVMGISAYYLLKKIHMEFAKASFKVALIFGFVSVFTLLPIGHFHGVQVARTQAAKMAAFEGIWETGTHAPMLLFGIPDETAQLTKYKVEIPSLLSLLIGGSRDQLVVGLNDFPKEERPPVFLTFASFHLMVLGGIYFLIFTVVGLILLGKNRLFENKFFLKLAMYSLPIPFIANELGWIAAEVGRQPWIVWGLLKTKEAISFNVPAIQILMSLVIFGFVYGSLFIIWVVVLRKKILTGPESY